VSDKNSPEADRPSRTIPLRQPAARVETPPLTSASDLAPPTVVGQPGDVVVPSSFVPLLPGYEVLEELGRGSMGVVYKARQVHADRVVALKVLREDLALDPRSVTRFRGEARAAARLDHPNIARVYDVGEHRGVPYYSMEFCPKGSLARRLARRGPLLPRQAAQLVRTLALAIHAGHERGVLHRDLKPGNILVAADGGPRIADFGLARCLDQMMHLTRTGDLVGTPSYMAPEQARGEHSAVSPATDVYGLGALLYTCLTGRPPFLADTCIDTMYQVVNQPPVPPRRICSTVPEAIEALCLRCLEKDPAARPASARELADLLARTLEDPTDDMPVAPPAPPPEPRHPRAPGRGARRQPWVPWAIAGLTVVLILLLLLLAWQALR
jgi:serine/threonine-protein kinase